MSASVGRGNGYEIIISLYITGYNLLVILGRSSNGKNTKKHDILYNLDLIEKRWHYLGFEVIISVPQKRRKKLEIYAQFFLFHAENTLTFPISILCIFDDDIF